MEKIVSFTGHRPNKFIFQNENHISCIELKHIIMEQIKKLYLEGNKIFLTGCAIGVDIWCGEIILDLIEKYNDIKLYCVIPFENQANRWTDDYRKRYTRLVDKKKKKIILQKNYSQDCYLKRNKFLVDKCTTLIGVYDGISQNSGTYSTLNYAINQNKDIIYINSNNFKRTFSPPDNVPTLLKTFSPLNINFAKEALKCVSEP